jgi:hypothetical protein
MRSLMFNGGITTFTKITAGKEGWGVFGSAEYSKKSWNSEFDFSQYILNVQRFQSLGRNESLNIRMRVGSADGTLPVQKIYELGGLGTLNAFPFKSEAGNRMLLFNAEIIVNGNILDDLDFWPTWIFRHVNILLLTDAGFTRNVSSGVSAADGFGNIHWDEFKHDFGVAFSNRSGSFRIGLAWRTDRPAPVQFLLRFDRPF